MGKDFLVIGLVVSVLLGPILLYGARFGLGASLLDGIGGSYSNSTFQEGVVNAGLLVTLIGMVAAPIFCAKFLKRRLASGLTMLATVGCFIAPGMLCIIVFGLPG